MIARRTRRRTSVTLILIFLNLIFFLVTYPSFLKAKSCEETLCKYVALTPYYVLHSYRFWTIITSMFVHAGFLHLFVNMISLFFLGSFLERLIGKKRFIFIYFASGILASLFFITFAFFSNEMKVPAVGASGAIFGLGGVLAILTPRLPVYIMFIPVPMPLWLGILVMLVLIWIVSALHNLPIGNTAHLGGLIAGLLYGLYLRKKYKRKVAILDRYFR